MNRLIDKITTELGKLMKEKKLTLTTVESCTGGGVAYFISKNPKSSAILERGYVTYSLQSKEELLEVPAYDIQTKGAVSKKVALAMAKGGLKNSASQICLATTGIAGPDTGHHQKNDGIVWIACVSNFAAPLIVKKLISGKREVFCEKIILESISMLLHYIKKYSS